ncbi:MAG TPA: SAM-dependent methyltransferase [Syntrophaceae bacterium]|jgi:ubiquinone/menaquinone biosynthesis C-methylase UbiE|nr:SAM-dependent methyltransferase [Syntrophaceae bacterium]
MDNQVDSDLTAQTKARYNRIAPYYDFIELLSERVFKDWRRKLIAHARGKILEIGVGTGKNFPYYPKDADITGIDIADKMLPFARKRADGLGLAIKLIEGDVQALSFPDNSFDTAIATFVFCSVPDPILGLRELRRVVKPDGQILLLEHVRIDRPVIGIFMDILNPVFVNLLGPNINRRTVENVERAGLMIRSIEHLCPMQMVKMIIAHPGK